MVDGHAPPFGWYWSASRSRVSAPASTAMRVTSPVAFGWFVENSPRVSASAKQRPPAARTRLTASTSARPSPLPPPPERGGVRGNPPPVFGPGEPRPPGGQDDPHGLALGRPRLRLEGGGPAA